MAEVVIGILKETLFLFNKMSPYLLFGFLFAGIIHIYINTSTVSRNLGKNSILSVIKASLLGIPLPLCSCSVIPTAMSLRKEGASRGAVISFLISTPTTGIDSIFATYSLLGMFFTVYRIAASFIAGVFSGILANIFIKEDFNADVSGHGECKMCQEKHEHYHGRIDKVKGAFKYAFEELLTDTGVAILGGVLVGGVISYFLPENFITTYVGSGWKAMLLMLVIGIPMYVCATASIPIAASLMIKGMDPGAAFVFLVAGPATNIVTMSVIAKDLGKRALLIYLLSIIVSSLFLGSILNKVFGMIYSGTPISSILYHERFMPLWLEFGSSIFLCTLMIFIYAKKRYSRKKV